MTLYNPGPGMGRAMHVRRVRALQHLERSGLISYDSYTTEDGYTLKTAAGEEREVASAEMAAYVAGMVDFYCSMRLDVDETVGEEALEALDNRYLDTLEACLKAVLPTGE